jgi:hypothetical protein
MSPVQTSLFGDPPVITHAMKRPCPKCGYERPNGPHREIKCARCDAYQRFAPKDEIL